MHMIGYNCTRVSEFTQVENQSILEILDICVK